MTPERWQQIDRLLEAALEREEPGERAAFLDEQCGDDTELRREVESLLVAHKQASKFIEESPAEAAAEMLRDEQTELQAGQLVGHYRILAELDSLLRAGWRGMVFIVDDNFIGNKRNVRALMPELVEWSERHTYPFAFVTEASVNLAEDEELLERMQSAGFRHVFLGIETPVEESLKETQKMQNLKGDLLSSVKKIQSYGMEVMAGFIIGFDHDPEDIFERQINFIRESAIPLAMVGLLTALPDTQLWRRLAREGRLIEESTGNNTDCSLNFVPIMNQARLVEGYKHVLRTIYSPGEYYRRSLKCLDRVASSGPEPRRIGFFGKTRALMRIILTLGVRDHARREFWRYLYRASARHKGRFAEAVTLAAMGYHFRKVTEEYCK